MNEVRNGEQKEQKYLYFEIFYGGQKLYKYFRSLLVKDVCGTRSSMLAGLSCTKGVWYIYDWDTGSSILI